MTKTISKISCKNIRQYSLTESDFKNTLKNTV